MLSRTIFALLLSSAAASICTLLSSYEIIGNEIAATPTSDPEDCCGTCSNLDKCKAWTIKDGTCSLKNSTSSLVFTGEGTYITTGILEQKKDDPCMALDVDLSDLKGQVMSLSKDGYKYDFQICSTTQCKTRDDPDPKRDVASFCQQLTREDKPSFNLGTFDDSGTWTKTDDGLSGVFKNGSPTFCPGNNRSTTVNIHCADGPYELTSVAEDVNGPCTYSMEVNIPNSLCKTGAVPAGRQFRD